MNNKVYSIYDTFVSFVEENIAFSRRVRKIERVYLDMIAPKVNENEVKVEAITDPEETLLFKNQSEPMPWDELEKQVEKEAEGIGFAAHYFTGDDASFSAWSKPFLDSGSICRENGKIVAKVNASDVQNSEALSTVELDSGDIVLTYGDAVISVRTLKFVPKSAPKKTERREPTVGDVWRHENGKDYQILSIAMNHGGQKSYVIYKEFGTAMPVWSREIENFMGKRKETGNFRFHLIGRAAVDFGTGEMILVPLR